MINKDYEKGMEAKEKYVEAHAAKNRIYKELYQYQCQKYFSAAAEAGCAEAYYQLAIAASTHEGFLADEFVYGDPWHHKDAAAALLKQAASCGHLQAMVTLGNYYDKICDSKQAAEWFAKAEEHKTKIMGNR